MLVGEGTHIKTDYFKVGEVTEVMDGREKGWRDQFYFRVKVLEPRVHHTKRNTIVRMDEITGIIND